jgi:hypothetical protein
MSYVQDGVVLCLGAAREPLDPTRIVLGWQGFDETKRQIRLRFLQRYTNEEQSWYTLVEAVPGLVDR